MQKEQLLEDAQKTEQRVNLKVNDVHADVCKQLIEDPYQ